MIGQPGTRETRWIHLLSGAPAVDAAPAAVAGNEILAVSEVATLKRNLARVEDELAALKIVVAKLCAELGIR